MSALRRFALEWIAPIFIGFVVGEVPQAAHQVTTGERPACCSVFDAGVTS